jgi:hypothetical protein
MRRSLASQYRVKTAHHLLNIVALKREMDTYNVDGLLKAASVGQSKEACLRYAGLQAALLIEKRAVDSYNFGPDTAAFKNNSPTPAAPVAKPPAARSGAPKPTQMSGFGAPSAVQLKPTSSGGGGYTGGNYMINTQATKPSTAPSNLTRGFLGGIADSQKASTPTGVPGLTLASPASPPPALNNAGTATRRQAPAPAPLTAGVIPKPTQGTANATSGLGYQPTGSGSGGKYSGTKPAPTPPENDMSSKKFKPTADTVDPVEEAYSKQLNEGAAADARSRANINMPSLSASSGSEGGVPAAQEAIAAQSGNNGFQRQQVIGSGAPVRTILGNMRGRRGR